MNSRILVLIAALSGASCAGLRVGPNSWAPAPAMRVATPDLGSYIAAPIADTTVHDNPAFAGTPLGDEDWLMVGRNDAHVWVTYLRFDLTALQSTDGVSQALVRLVPAEDAVVLRVSPAFAVDVYAVAGPWDEESLVWRSQPFVGQVPLVRGATRLSTYDVDTFDVTAWVNELVAAGETELNLALLPAPDVHDGRRRWRSRESVPALAEDVSAMPRLEVTAGRAPPRGSQATRSRVGR